MSSRIWDTFVSKCVTKNFLKTRNLVTLMCVRERKVKCKFREIENSLFTWFQFNNKTNFDTNFLDSLSLSHIHFFYISFSLSLSLSLSLFLTHTLSHTISLSHPHTLFFISLCCWKTEFLNFHEIPPSRQPPSNPNSNEDLLNYLAAFLDQNFTIFGAQKWTAPKMFQ